VLFVRKLVKGGSAHSFGIHVQNGRNASNCNFESTKAIKEEKTILVMLLNGIKSEKDEMQMSFFNLDDPLLEEIKEEILNLILIPSHLWRH
jgi:DNA mismatch repair protein MutS